MRTAFAVMALSAGLLVTGACGGGSSKASAPVTGPKVTLRALSFDPDAIDVKAGETVTWVWAERIAHNVTFPSFHSKTVSSGTYKHTFTTPGTFQYKCTIHPTMNGKVVVTAA